MLVPEIPFNISSPQEIFKASLEKLQTKIDAFHLNYTKKMEKTLSSSTKKIRSQERLQKMLNTTHSQLQISKLQTQPMEVSGFDLSLVKATYFDFGFNNDKATKYFPSGILPAASCLQTQMNFVTSLSCDL